MTLYKALFLFQHNVQNQNHVAQKRSSCHNDSCFCQRTFFDNGRRSCGNRTVGRRFHTGVGRSDPPVAVFTDEGGQTVCAFIAFVPFIPFFSTVALIAGGSHSEGSPALPAVIGDIPNVIVPDFKLGRYAVFSVCAVFAVSTVFTVLAINAIFAIGTILSVSAGVAFVALVAFLAGRLYSEGSPALTAVIGDIPNVIVPDFKPGRYAVFAIGTVFTGVSRL